MRNQLKVITNIPGWTDLFSTGKLSGVSGAYRLVPVIYRCFSMRCDSLSSVPLKLYKKGKSDQPVEWPWKDFDPVDWTWKTVAALSLKGAAYSVILRNGLSPKPQGLQWMNPLYMTPLAVVQDGQVSVNFQASALIGGSTNAWTQAEMLYIKLYNPTDDYLPGPSPMDVALNDADLIYYMTRFAGRYFEQGGMPVTILGIDKQTKDEEVSRVDSLFKSLVSGIRNAWRVIALRVGKDMTPFKLTSDLKDLTMPALEDRARRAIAASFGIPQTMIEDAANFATAKEHRLSYWQDTIMPVGKKIESALNTQVLNPLGYEAHYDFGSLDIFQEDEAERAGQLNTLVAGGLDVLTACEVLGYELTDEQIARILAKNVAQQSPVNPPVSADDRDPQALRSALFNWKAAALKAVKTGNRANVEFDHPAVPEHVADGIRMALDSCQTADEVHEVFKEAREWIKIPADTSVLAEQLKRATDLLERVA